MTDYISQGNEFLLSYFINTINNIKNKQMHFCGFHKGQITGNNINVESFSNIPDLISRVEELELILSKEMAQDILDRAEKHPMINLDEETITRIKEYSGIEE